MLGGILPQADTDIYLTCVNLDTGEQIEKMRAYGEPTAESSDMEAIVKDLSWVLYTKIKKHAEDDPMNQLQISVQLNMYLQ